MLVGSDLTTEIAFIDEPEKNSPNQPFGSKSNAPDRTMVPSENNDETFKRRESDNFTTLSIASGAFNEAHINGKPVTIGDLTGKVIGAPMLPRRTRTIEDKAYTIRYDALYFNAFFNKTSCPYSYLVICNMDRMHHMDLHLIHAQELFTSKSYIFL